MTITPDRLTVLDTINLDNGSHSSFDEGHCAMEVVAWLAGEGHTDAPNCASPVLRTFTISLNDQWDSEQRQTLLAVAEPGTVAFSWTRALVRAGRIVKNGSSVDPDWMGRGSRYLVPMIGTAGDGQDETRSYLALDWLIRTYTPAWLDLAGLTVEAQALRDLRRIVDEVAAKEAGPVVRAGAEKAAAAGAAAGDAAWDAAGDAAGAAAGDAAGAAAGDAAGDAAWDALKPTVQTLQASALDLLDAMIDPDAVTA